MEENIERIIEIPEGIEVNIKGNELLIKGSGKEIRKKLDMYKISIVVNDRKIKISSKGSSRKKSKLIGTIWAHINNMIKGINKDFIYKLEICNIHFPMNVKVQGDKIIIKSFLGETTERVAKILSNVKVEVKGNEIIISS